MTGPLPQRACECGQHTAGGACQSCAAREAGALARPAVTIGPVPGRADITVTSPHAPQEEQADQVAHRIAHQGADAGLDPAAGNGPAGPAPSGAHTARSSPLPADGGGPLTAAVREPMEHAFGRSFVGVRVHTGPAARAAAAQLGARAVTQGSNIWLGPGERTSDGFLLAHELAHVVQSSHGAQASGHDSQAISLRRATWLERRAWLSFFDHYLPRKLLNNYMDDSGAPITLTQTEMADCNPIVDLRRSQAFLTEVARLRAAGGGTKAITVSGAGLALTNGTLANFTIYYRGDLSVTRSGDWSFVGTMEFYDYWDFDPKPLGSGRSLVGEIKTRVGAAAIPGKPFKVHSVVVPVSQTSADTRAMWGAHAPVPVHEPLVRTGADIEVGAGAGAAGGPPGAEVGTEAGAQAAEDLNR